MTRFYCLFVLILAGLLTPQWLTAEQPAATPEVARSIALETTRQELIETRLDELLLRFQQLTLDTRSNPGAGEAVGQTTAELEERLRTLKITDVANARAALKRAAQQPAAAAADLLVARTAIDRAARELASLLLRAGMAPAAEVFAREIRDIIEQQEELQRRTLGAANSEPVAPVGGEQKALAERLNRLVAEVASLPPAQTDALSAVRIVRAHKIITAGATTDSLSAAVDALNRRAFVAAVPFQGKTLTVLRQAEGKLRADATLQALVRSRNVLQELLAGQRTLRTQIAALPDAGFSAQRQVWQRRQLALAHPLAQIDVTVGLAEALAAATTAAQEAADQLAAADRTGAGRAQDKFADIITAAIEQLQQRIADMQGLATAYRRLQEATGRLKNLQDISDRQAQATEGAQTALLGQQELASVTGVEQHLSDEIARFSLGLPAGNPWTPAVQRALNQAAESAGAAAKALKDHQTKRLPPQFDAVSSALAAAVDLSKKEVNHLEQMWSLMQLSGDLTEISRALGDITEEQLDLQTRCQAAGAAGSAENLAATQAMLVQALEEVNQLVEPILEAAPLKPPLDTAKQAMNTALERLHTAQPDAVGPLAATAIAELERARKSAGELAAKAQYLAELAAELEQFSASASDLLQRQILLRKKTESAEPAEFTFISGEQDVLQGEATVLSEVPLESAAVAYRTAASEMGLAIAQLAERHREDTVAHQLLAEKALRTGIEELQKYLASLEHLLTAMNDIEMPDTLNVLSALFFLAIQEKDLGDVTHTTPAAGLAALAPKQIELQKSATDLTAVRTLEPVVKHIQNAIAEMDQATGLLQQASRQPAVAREQAAEKYLRMAMADIVMKIIFAPPSDEPPPDASGPMDPDMLVFDSYEHLATFMKDTPGGAAVNRDRAEWESLTDRDRSALNENFARELPLEYRQLLKNYYEELAK